MESLNNISTAVTKAIWGTDETANQEPVSGKVGDVSKGQPYDAGNMEPNEQSLAQTPQPTTTEPKFESNPDTAPSTASTDTSAPHGTLPTSATLLEDHNSSKDDTPAPHKPTLTTAAPDNDASSTTPAPHKTPPSSSGPGDHTASQSDTRHPSDLAADHHASAPKQDVDNTTGGLDVGDSPDKLLSGPGPRPLEVVAKEHDGDAGRIDDAPPKQEVGGGDSDGAPLERHDSGHSDGKGLIHVKSSGLVADGGDFDAAKPGAAREADRILEQKGVDRDPAAHGGLMSNSKGSGDADAVDRLNASGMAGEDKEKEKVSLKTKIKNKLHLGSHSGESTAGPA